MRMWIEVVYTDNFCLININFLLFYFKASSILLSVEEGEL